MSAPSRNLLHETDVRLRSLERRAASTGSKEDQHAYWTAKERSDPGSVERDHIAPYAKKWQEASDTVDSHPADSPERKESAKRARESADKLFDKTRSFLKWKAQRTGKSPDVVTDEDVTERAARHIKRENTSSWENHIGHLAHWHGGKPTPDRNRRGRAPRFASDVALQWHGAGVYEFLKSLEHHKAGSVQRHRRYYGGPSSLHNVEINRPEHERQEEDMNLTELRDSCLSCTRKHLSQALILMQEVKQGYPQHRWLAVGHMGEAADEALKEYPKLADEIRKHRLKYMANADYEVPIMELIKKASKLAGDLTEGCGCRGKKKKKDGLSARMDDMQYQRGKWKKNLIVDEEKSLVKPEWPAVADDDKAFVILWADGRGIVAFRNKKDAKAFADKQSNDAVWVHYESPVRKTGRPGRRRNVRLKVCNNYSPKQEAVLNGVNVLTHHPGEPRTTSFLSETGERVFSPEIHTTLSKFLPEARSEERDSFRVNVKGDYGGLRKMLNYIKDTAQIGHSFEVVVDPDDSQYRKRFDIDGDGPFRMDIEEERAERCGSVAVSLLKPGTKVYEKWLAKRNRARKKNQQEDTVGLDMNRTPLSPEERSNIESMAETAMELTNPDIMFWTEDHRPQDYAGQIEDVDHEKVTAVIKALKEGETKARWRGWANCRICDEHLGSQDLGNHGFKWPQMAEHYIEEHGVWTPGLDRFGDALLAEDAKGEKADMKHCGVFIPLPYSIAKDFPDKKHEDDSVPHYTILYMGDMKPKAYKALCKLVRQFAQKLKPFECDTASYSEFLNPKGQKISHMTPSPLCRTKLAILHATLRRYIEKAGKGLSIKHTYGRMDAPGVPNEIKFKPHATLAYLPSMMPYKGPKPTGSWKVTELECWGYEKVRVPLGMTKAVQPIGLTREPLATKYPQAVPEPVAEDEPVTHVRYITRQELLNMKDDPGQTFTVGEARARAHLEMKRTGFSAEEILRQEDVVGGSMGAVGKGLGGSSGDVGLDGSLPYLKVQKDLEKKLQRKKLAGLK